MQHRAQGPLFIRVGTGKKPGFLHLLLLIGGALLLLTFGVWLLMIFLTLGVLLLPYLWWKKRKLIKTMQEQMAQYQQQQQAQAGQTGREESTSGVVIEGEVLQKRQE